MQTSQHIDSNSPKHNLYNLQEVYGDTKNK